MEVAVTRPWHRFRFRGVWRGLPAPPDQVYAELEQVGDYPCWWPQIREASARDHESGTLRMRSVLPLELRVTLRAEWRDPAARELRVAMEGDLSGWVRCLVAAEDGGGSRVEFEQYTEVATPFLRLVALPARPLLRANHAWMMRSGNRGLAARLRGLEEG